MTEVPAAPRGQKLPKLMRFLGGRAIHGPWEVPFIIDLLMLRFWWVFGHVYSHGHFTWNWWLSKNRPTSLSCFPKDIYSIHDIPFSVGFMSSLHRRRSKQFSKNMTSTTTASSNMMWLGNIGEKYTSGFISKPILWWLWWSIDFAWLMGTGMWISIETHKSTFRCRPWLGTSTYVDVDMVN